MKMEAQKTKWFTRLLVLWPHFYNSELYLVSSCHFRNRHHYINIPDLDWFMVCARRLVYQKSQHCTICPKLAKCQSVEAVPRSVRTTRHHHNVVGADYLVVFLLFSIPRFSNQRSRLIII